MKKSLLSFATLVFLIGCQNADAQVAYAVTYDTAAYVPLTSGANVSGTTPWDSSYIFSAPLGFTFHVGTTALTHIFLDMAYAIDFITDTTGLVNYTDFQLEESQMTDRGNLGSTSKSPIRYQTTGTAGNHIFKMELFNAGFQTEYNLSGTLNDSMNVQIWLYEANNAIEYHFGPSQVSDATDYFNNGIGPQVGYYPSLDTNGNGTFYLIENNPVSLPPYPATMLEDTLANSALQGLDTFPPSGTVYRFYPVPISALSIKNIAENNGLRVYPTLCSNYITIDNNNGEGVYTIIGVTGVPTGITGTLQNGKTRVNVSSLPDGMYLLQTQNSNGRSVYKFVRQ